MTREDIAERFEKESGKKWWVNPVCHGEMTFASDDFVLWLTDALRKAEEEQDALKEQVAGIVAKKIQPCGCVLCFCEGDRCRGCGAKMCADQNCLVRHGHLEYEKHPAIVATEAKAASEYRRGKRSGASAMMAIMRSEYNEARVNGCDENGSWDCAIDGGEKYIDSLLLPPPEAQQEEPK